MNDVGKRFGDSALSPQARIWHGVAALFHFPKLPKALVVSLLAGIFMPADARILLPEGNTAVPSHPSGNYSHPFHNTRGDVMAEFSAAGILISHSSRDADGLPLDTYGTATGPYGPNGKWQEPGGLVNDGFRHRDLHSATFLTRDPAGFIDGPNTYNYVGHNPWSAFDPNGLATTIPVTTGEIGYVGAPSVSWNDPPMISDGANAASGTIGSAAPYGGSPDGGGPGATVDPVSEAVEIRPSSLYDSALDAYEWVSAISSGYYFGSDYLPGVFSAEYPEDYTPDKPEHYREPKLGSAAYNRDKAWELVLFFTELPGKTVATAITLGGATDLTTGSEVTYDLEYGFGTSEVTPGSRWVAGALIVLPMRSGGYVDDGIRILTRKSESTVVRIGTRIETKTGTEMAENAANRGYHATDPVIADKIVQSGEFWEGSGRVGKGQYVADTPDGAIAEFRYHNGDKPVGVVEVEYDPGTNLDIRGMQEGGYKPSVRQGNRLAAETSADSITYQSIREGGSANTVIRNGSGRPIRREH